MSLIVQKFGGTSLADATAMRLCARRVADARAIGASVVVVVSAMGRATDDLLALADEAHPEPPRRDLDLLLATGEQASAALMSMTLQTLGIRAVACAGLGVGLATTDRHTRATIDSIDTDRLRARLDDGAVVVVAGFQGVSPVGDITTLGRGGSDLTAVALAASLNADRCEIYTDVAGVYTADTRIVPDARRLDRLSYDQMLELAEGGARVLHPRAALCAKTYSVPVRIAHAHADGPGTLITLESRDMESIVVSGCALKPDIARITLAGAPNSPGSPSALFERLAEADVFVDDIIQAEADANTTTIAVTTHAGEAPDARRAAEFAAADLGRGAVTVETGLASVSVVGLGMRTHTGVASTLFRALADASINVRNVTTSEIRISCIIDAHDGPRALHAAHAAFGLARGASVEPVAPV